MKIVRGIAYIDLDTVSREYNGNVLGNKANRWEFEHDLHC